MTAFLNILIPIIFLILLLLLTLSLKGLQLHLYEHHKHLWERITIRKFLFVKRENFPALLFSYKILPVIFTNDNLGDKIFRRYKIRIRLLMLICIIYAAAASPYLFWLCWIHLIFENWGSRASIMTKKPACTITGTGTMIRIPADIWPLIPLGWPGG